MVQALEEFPVLGLPVHLSENYVRCLAARLQQQQGTHVVTLNAEMAMQAEQDAALATIIRQAEFVIPDGAGVVFYLRLQGHSIRRCPGIELAEQMIQSSVQQTPPWTVFFYGGKPGVAEAAAQRWQKKLPNLAIAGIQHGYLSAEEQADLRRQLAEIQPNLILVGLGVPRQEQWIVEHRQLCPRSVWIGIGGSLDIWAGLKTRAPIWFQKNHLEWLYRLYQEPWRWRRMLALPKFAWRAVLHRFA